jgi:hypothetical protein
MKGHKSIERILDNKTYSDIQEADYYESNKFYVEYYHDMESKSYNNQKKNFDSGFEIIDIDDIVEDTEESVFAEEFHPTTKNNIITTYDVPYQTLRLNNKYILLNTEEYDKEIELKKKIKLKKWVAYKNESSMLPHDVTRFNEGIKYFMARNKKNPDYIQVKCKPKVVDFDYLFFDKKVETYLKNIIAKKLSKRQKLLIRYLYYEMLPVGEIVNSMNYTSKTALNKEKSRALQIIKHQLLKDYEFIQNEYGETFLAYWVRLIKDKFNRFAKKGKKMLSI